MYLFGVWGLVVSPGALKPLVGDGIETRSLCKPCKSCTKYSQAKHCCVSLTKAPLNAEIGVMVKLNTPMINIVIRSMKTM